MKKWFASIMVVVMLLTAAPLSGFVGLDLPNIFDVFASAESYSDTCGDNLTWSLDTETGELVVSGTGTMTNYSATSPAPWDAYRSQIKTLRIESGVTTIGNDTFFGCENLTSVEIPAGVTKIGNTAFRECVSLTEITLPDSVTSIGHYAFYACKKLEYAHIGTGIKTIGNHAFRNCAVLGSITLPGTITNIGNNAFNGCSALSSAVFCGGERLWKAVTVGTGNEQLTEIITFNQTVLETGTCGKSLTWTLYTDGELVIDGTGAMEDYYEGESNAPWYYIRSKIKAVTIGNGVRGIGRRAFASCYYLADVTIGESVIFIGDSAFELCTGLKSIDIPDNVLSLHNEVFYGCTKLESVDFGKGISDIGESCFEGCTALKNAVLPEGLRIIERDAFLSCSSLESVTIPKSVEETSGLSFYGCNLKDIYYTGNASDWCRMMESSHPIEHHANVYFEGALVQDIVLEEGIEIIDFGTFKNFKDLQNVTLPKSLKRIDYCAFEGCYALNEVKYMGNVVDWCGVANADLNLLFYAEYFYINGELAEDIVIPEGVETIKYGAFYGCPNLVSITIPKSVTSMDLYAFGSCDVLEEVHYGGKIEDWCQIDFLDTVSNPLSNGAALYCNGEIVENLVIPDSVTSIKDFAFCGCGGFKKVTIPSTVTSIGKFAFRYCTAIEEFNLPDSIVHMGYAAFGYCPNIPRTTENGLTYIGNYLVSVDSSIPSKIVIREGTLCIAERIFTDYHDFTEVTIPATIIGISADVFSDCRNLVNIYYNGDLADWCAIDFENSLANPLFYAKCFYVKGELVEDFIDLEGATTINAYAFYDFDILKTVTIPDTVTDIGEYAFYHCSALTSITIGNGVKNIGDYAFYNCTKLSDVKLGSNVTTIGNRAFYNCSTLTGVVLPDSIESVGQYAFNMCSALESVTFGKRINHIGESAFKDCGSLKNVYYTGDVASWCGVERTVYSLPVIENLYIGGELVTGTLVIPEGVTHIKDYTFSGYKKITGLTIPDSVRNIGINAFNSCSNLKDVDLGDGVTKIGKSAFSHCSSIVNLTIPKSLTDFDLASFSQLTGLENVYYTGTVADWCAINFENFFATPMHNGYGGNLYIDGTLVTNLVIPDGVTKINDYVFQGCNSIKSVTISDSVTEIGCSAFRDCENLKTLILGDNVKIIGENAFYSCDDLTGVVIPDGVTTIGKSAFHMCPSLTDVTVPDSVTELGQYAFYGCKNLKNVTVGNGVKVIAYYTFYACTSLKTITLSNSIEKISNLTFADCDAITDVYYAGTEEEWRKLAISGYGCLPNNATIHFNYVSHKCEFGEWTVDAEPTATEAGSKTHTCPACGKTETVTIPATGFEMADGVAIDYATNTISGFNAGETSLDGYATTVNDNYTWEYETENGKLGTGSKAILKDGDTVICEYTVLVYGDTTGDSWYDGQDAIIVDCLANGMLTKEDVGEAVYTAADCNHDGVIDQLDVALLNEAGMLLTNVDQSKPADVLLETSAEYVEYLDLIDQSPEIEIEDETEDTTPEQDAEVDIFGMIINFIKSIFEMIFSHIPVPFN